MPPLGLSELEVHWFNKPASGRMSGNMFTDGSAIFRRIGFLHRAGWSIASVDRFGNLKAAA